jgi:hypothetical protein
MITYTLISSDSHIIEPADLWEQRIARRFKDRAPRLVHEEAGVQCTYVQHNISRRFIPIALYSPDTVRRAHS